MNIGNKIRTLRKQKNMSQENLASAIGVTYQSVSKWENGITMPDVALIPAIAAFFSISCDELFDYNLLEIEMKVDQICKEAVIYRHSDPQQSEAILRAGLKKYPGNEILLNNLLYTMRSPERSEEVIALCKSLIDSTHLDDVKYDACRILAETYALQGELELTKAAINQIPEIYFTKLELDARLLKGEEGFKSARLQIELAVEMLIEMLECCAEYYQDKGDIGKAEEQMMRKTQLKQLFEVE